MNFRFLGRGKVPEVGGDVAGGGGLSRAVRLITDERQPVAAFGQPFEGDDPIGAEPCDGFQLAASIDY